MCVGALLLFDSDETRVGGSNTISVTNASVIGYETIFYTSDWYLWLLLLDVNPFSLYITADIAALQVIIIR